MFCLHIKRERERDKLILNKIKINKLDWCVLHSNLTLYQQQQQKTYYQSSFIFAFKLDI